jgi:hypothetical protein
MSVAILRELVAGALQCNFHILERSRIERSRDHRCLPSGGENNSGKQPDRPSHRLINSPVSASAGWIGQDAVLCGARDCVFFPLLQDIARLLQRRQIDTRRTINVGTVRHDRALSLQCRRERDWSLSHRRLGTGPLLVVQVQCADRRLVCQSSGALEAAEELSRSRHSRPRRKNKQGSYVHYCTQGNCTDRWLLLHIGREVSKCSRHKKSRRLKRLITSTAAPDAAANSSFALSMTRRRAVLSSSPVAAPASTSSGRAR